MNDRRANISVRLPPDLVEEINKAAEREGCTQVEWLRRAVRSYLASQVDRLPRLRADGVAPRPR